MNIGELILHIKSGLLSELYPVSSVREKDIDGLTRKGYVAPLTKDAFCSKFPWIPVEMVYLSKVMTEGLVYYDPKKHICFLLNIFGEESIISDNGDNGQRYFENVISRIEKEYTDKNFSFLVRMAPESYRIELLGKIIKNAVKPLTLVMGI